MYVLWIAPITDLPIGSEVFCKRLQEANPAVEDTMVSSRTMTDSETTTKAFH